MRDPGEKASKPCKVLVWDPPIPGIFEANDHAFLEETAVPAVFTMVLAQLPGITLLLETDGAEGTIKECFLKIAFLEQDTEEKNKL